MPSNAEQYYKKITSPEYRYDYLSTLPERKQQENEWLEFKAADKIEDRNIKENWSTALSGFANTGGGVLIWGIKADKNNETGIDCASALALAPDADLFAQKLTDCLLDAVAPAITGIQIASIKKDGQRAGFVVCLIPEGTNKAHRAELSPDKQFYIRIRDKFHVPAAATVRSLFDPRLRASLVPSVTVSPANHKDLLTLWLALTNDGNITGKNISIIVHHHKSLSFLPMQSGFIHSPTSLSERIPLIVIPSINPDMTQDAIFGFRFSNPTSLQQGFDLMVKVSCEDCPLLTWTRHIEFEELLNPGRLHFTLFEK